MNRTLNVIAARLSLRDPQRAALDILVDLLENVGFDRNADLAATLEAVRARYPGVEDFEREFPSLCFALATGVGKTRLMGAFIAYLYLTGRSRHFMVLAPNLTIYEKLKSDFRPDSPKYVFRGIAEFAQLPPLIVTGENYEQGEATRHDLFADETRPHINIFNISKLTSTENRAGAIRTRTARIRRLQECIGESYFDFLAGLDDLVVLMDEAHRYRASAGAQTLAELRPRLGLELTATPKTIGARPKAFRNVVYAYTLGAAIRDGLVKIPAVATRRDFDASRYSRDELERIKLEDGIHHHEYVKGELLTFAATHNAEPVKPFMLVVAQDTAHAGEVKAFIERPDFFDGRYRGRVIEVHSNLKGEESDEAMQRLLAVEHDAGTEIVIHVNKLKEGWDVTNLYTIVPLRASASEILTEQTLGRGLRLPWGRRTGVVAIDRLTVIAHDRFQDIVDAAERDDSFIRQTVYIGDGDGDDVPKIGTEVITVEPRYRSGPETPGPATGQPAVVAALPEPVRTAIEQATVEAIRDEERRLASVTQLTQPAVQARVLDAVRERLVQADMAMQLPLGLDPQDVGDPLGRVVAELSTRIAQQTIDVPEIVLIPDGEASYTFEPFALAGLDGLRYTTPEHEVLVRRLDDRSQARIAARELVLREARVEDYLVGALIERPEIDYDAHADLLYGLAGQVAEHVRSYAADEDEVHRNLAGRRDEYAAFIWAQMRGHQRRAPLTYQVRVTRGFTVLRPNVYTLPAGERPGNFRQPPERPAEIRKYVFGGFARCCYPYQKFQSVEGEQRLAIILEDDPQVLRWMKPAPRQFRIEYDNDKPYEPDFVVETRTDILMIEPKRADEMDGPIVLAKARAAVRWCRHASEHAARHGGKPWRYLLVPHTAIDLAQSIDGLRARWARSSGLDG